MARFLLSHTHPCLKNCSHSDPRQGDPSAQILPITDKLTLSFYSPRSPFLFPPYYILKVGGIQVKQMWETQLYKFNKFSLCYRVLQNLL